MTNIRSVKEIKRGLLHRAFSENRGAEMIAEIQKRHRRVRDAFSEDEQRLIGFEIDNHGQPRAVRAFNACAVLDGSPHRLSESVLYCGQPYALQ